jgi:hypothetical protein
MREFTSEEKYDLSKFLNFEQDVYDVLDSPFLAQLKQLPIVSYYKVDEGYKEIDLIALDVYGDTFLAYLLQFYNNDFREVFPEGTVLNIFSLTDLNQIYTELSNKSKGANS